MSGKVDCGRDGLALGCVESQDSDCGVNRAGVAVCLRQQTGEELWDSRRAGQCWASSIGCGGRVDVFGVDGWTEVVAAGDEFVRVAENRLSVEGRLYGAAIVDICILSAYGANPGQSAYASSKAGLVAATRVAAHELGPMGVRVNAILPSFVSTPLTAGAGDEVRASLLSRTPLGRFPDLQEVAATVTWLLSPDASYVSGAELRVSGGRLF